METLDRGTEPGSLLILEDDWDHRKVFRAFLEHRGWSVREATNASVARQTLASERIDVVVLDLGGTNGWDLLEELGTSAERPRVVCLTGDAREESRARAQALGADLYLLKPIPLRALADAVERLVGATSDADLVGSPAGRWQAGTRPQPRPQSTTSATPSTWAGKAAGRARPVVLLLEDDEDARVIYRDMLDFAGYEVLAACDGVEGLRLAESRPPDVVVTDLHIPGMNGVQVARTLREEA